MDFKQWLNEMPMQNFQRIGDWESPKKPTDAYQKRRAPAKGFYSDDHGILTSDAGVEKIKRKWSKCEEPFSVFVLRSNVAAKQREVGMVDVAYLENTLKLKPEIIQQINNPSTINIVYTNNMGAERMPMNWWTMAHRVGHAIDRSSYSGGSGLNAQVPGYAYYTRTLVKGLYEILDQVFNYQKKSEFEGRSYGGGYGYEQRKQQPSGAQLNQKMLLSLAMEIGSMRSARERKIRPSGPMGLSEFFHELTAQYIIEGGVHFRPMPKMLIQGYAWGRPQGRWRHMDQEDVEGWNDYLTDHLAPETNSNIGHALRGAIGKIFVM